MGTLGSPGNIEHLGNLGNLGNLESQYPLRKTKKPKNILSFQLDDKFFLHERFHVFPASPRSGKHKKKRNPERLRLCFPPQKRGNFLSYPAHPVSCLVRKPLLEWSPSSEAPSASPGHPPRSRENMCLRREQGRRLEAAPPCKRIRQHKCRLTLGPVV